MTGRLCRMVPYEDPAFLRAARLLWDRYAVRQFQVLIEGGGYARVDTGRLFSLDVRPAGEAGAAIRFYRVKERYGCFSNFAPFPVRLDRVVWPTSEHYFQAQKLLDEADREEIRLTVASPMEAARMGRSRARAMRPDWEAVKVDVMREAVCAKFSQHPDLRRILLATGEATLVEHTPRDAFWGDGGDGQGQNHEQEVCHAVAEALIAIGDTRAVEPLIEMLADPSPAVRQNAASALEGLGDPRAIEPLRSLLVGDDPTTRYQAISALVRLGDTRAERLLAMLDTEYDPRIANALAYLRERRAVEPLIAHLTAAVERLRGGGGAPRDVGHHHAAGALGAIGDPRAVPVLIDMLEHDPSVASYGAWSAGEIAASALARIGDRRAFEPLVRALDAAEELTRKAAAEALGKLGDERSLAVLQRVLETGTGDVREGACLGLGHLRDPRAVEPLLRALADADHSVRRFAAEALGRSDPRAVGPLAEALRDAESGVREAAAIALGTIGDPRAVPPLVEALGDADWWVVGEAAAALGRLGDARAVEPLMARVTDRGTHRRLRLAAIRALGHLGDRRSAPALAWARDHECGRNAEAAAEALAR